MNNNSNQSFSCAKNAGLKTSGDHIRLSPFFTNIVSLYDKRKNIAWH